MISRFDADADAGAAAERLREEFAGDENVTLGGGAVVGPQVGETVGRTWRGRSFSRFRYCSCSRSGSSAGSSRRCCRSWSADSPSWGPFFGCGW